MSARGHQVTGTDGDDAARQRLIASPVSPRSEETRHRARRPEALAHKPIKPEAKDERGEQPHQPDRERSLDAIVEPIDPEHAGPVRKPCDGSGQRDDDRKPEEQADHAPPPSFLSTSAETASSARSVPTRASAASSHALSCGGGSPDTPRISFTARVRSPPSSRACASSEAVTHLASSILRTLMRVAAFAFSTSHTPRPAAVSTGAAGVFSVTSASWSFADRSAMVETPFAAWAWRPAAASTPGARALNAWSSWAKGRPSLTAAFSFTRAAAIALGLSVAAGWGAGSA